MQTWQQLCHVSCSENSWSIVSPAQSFPSKLFYYKESLLIQNSSGYATGINEICTEVQVKNIEKQNSFGDHFFNMTAQLICVNALHLLANNFCFYYDFNANLLSGSQKELQQQQRKLNFLVQSVNEEKNFMVLERKNLLAQ